jgi:hypothetical protein
MSFTWRAKKIHEDGFISYYFAKSRYNLFIQILNAGPFHYKIKTKEIVPYNWQATAEIKEIGYYDSRKTTIIETIGQSTKEKAEANLANAVMLERKKHFDQFTIEQIEWLKSEKLLIDEHGRFYHESECEYFKIHFDDKEGDPLDWAPISELPTAN